MARHSIPAVLREQVNKLRARPMVFAKRDAHWRPLTWAQVGERSSQVAAGLCVLGVKPGDRVAILAESGVEWVLADLGSQCAGAVTAPIYEAAAPVQVEAILRDSGARVVFCSGAAQVAKVDAMLAGLTELTHVIWFDETLSRPNSGQATVPGMSLLALEQLGRIKGDPDEVTARIDAIAEEDLLTLIYTSGTTGEQKGVMITHGNMLSNCEATARAIQVRSDDVVLSFLPLSHAFERMAGYYMTLLFGGAVVYFSEGLGRLLHDLRDVRPTLMTGVPRVYEKIHAGFLTQRALVSLGRRLVIDAGLRAGRQVSAALQAGRKPGRSAAFQYHLAKERVFGSFRERLGGRMRFFVSGGAPLAPEVAEFFFAAGILILEGYGLSETSPVVAVNRPDAFRFGTVGRPLDNVRVRIAADGEILVRGPNVMRGYYNQPDETARVITADGWLMTGDIGELDEDGFLRITDRKKDLFKTAGASDIAPQKLELLLCARAKIAQACVVGDRRPYCVALIVPSFDELWAWARERSLDVADVGELLRHAAVKSLIAAEVETVNRQLAKYESIKSFRILSEPFTIDNGLLTSSHKIRRRAIIERYGPEIDALYTEGPGGRVRMRRFRR